MWVVGLDGVYCDGVSLRKGKGLICTDNNCLFGSISNQVPTHYRMPSKYCLIKTRIGNFHIWKRPRPFLCASAALY